MDLYGIGQCIFFKKFFCGVKVLAANSAFFCGNCWCETECKGDPGGFRKKGVYLNKSVPIRLIGLKA